MVQEEDFDILEKLKDKYDPNEIVKIKEEMSKEAADASQPTISAINTPNPPPVATFAADSDSEMKETKPEVDEAMPLADEKIPVADDTVPEASNEAPSREVDSVDVKPNLALGSESPLTPEAHTSPLTPDEAATTTAENDVEMD